MSERAQRYTEELARRMLELIEREKAAGRWFVGRDGGASVPGPDHPEPRIARGDTR